MRRLLAHLAEAARRADDAFAEMVLPDAVDHDARGQRILWRDQPVRESAPAVRRLCVGRRRRERVVAPGGDREDARRHLRSLGVDAAAMQEERWSRVPSGVPDRHCRRERLGFLLFQRRDLLVECRVPGLLLGRHHRHEILLGDLRPQRIVLQRLLDLRRVQLLTLGALRRRRLVGDLQVLGEQRDFLVDELLQVRRLDVLLGRTQRPDQAVDASGLLAVGLDLVCRHERMLDRSRREEHCLDAVVVLLRNRIELVVVAPRAAHRHAHERQRGRGHQIVEGILPAALAAAQVGADTQESGRRHRLVARRSSQVVELVSGQLFADELRVRLVLVERVDDVVAVAPAFGAIDVELEAARIGIANEIQPVARPSLAVVRRGEQRVDEFRPGVRLSDR